MASTEKQKQHNLRMMVALAGLYQGAVYGLKVGDAEIAKELNELIKKEAAVK